MLNAPTLFKVEGRVLTDDYPLPGCVVRLESASREVRATVSDAEGRYRFHGVPNGEWDLHFTLDGFDDRYKHVLVRDADATARPVALRMTSIVDTIRITFTCGGSDDTAISNESACPSALENDAAAEPR